MTGKMVPETNWAPKEALNSSSLRSSKRATDSSSRPKTFMRSWPEKDSSICPFSEPVDFHWAANRPWALVPMRAAATPESGRAIKAISASCQETMNIMITMPMTVSSAWSNCENAC